MLLFRARPYFWLRIFLKILDSLSTAWIGIGAGISISSTGDGKILGDGVDFGVGFFGGVFVGVGLRSSIIGRGRGA
uniref:Candidate secreted effector n=1 Tax=Meloidogyne incognita TaxID=6306 RepID=A0A914M0H7_MELIC